MRGTVAKRLRSEARKRAMDGSVIGSYEYSVIGSYEYNRLKKLYNNPTYAPVVVLFPSKPDDFLVRNNKIKIAHQVAKALQK